MAHQVNLKLHKTIVAVAHKDLEISVRRSGRNLGTLLISKGNIEWRTAHKSVKKHRFTWSKFARFMQDAGKPVRAKH